MKDNRINWAEERNLLMSEACGTGSMELKHTEYCLKILKFLTNNWGNEKLDEKWMGVCVVLRSAWEFLKKKNKDFDAVNRLKFDWG